MSQPTRPVPQFKVDDQVWTPADHVGYVSQMDWRDGGWTYLTWRLTSDKLTRYAEHELEPVR